MIAGAGPSGSACALSLAEAGYRVLIVEKQIEHHYKWGETVSGSISILLKNLGLWRGFLDQQHLRSYENNSLWGSDESLTSSTLLNPYGNGWHLDRDKFEELLRSQLRLKDLTFLPNTTLTDLSQPCDGYRPIDLSNGESVKARYLVDATGRQRAITRKLNIKSFTACKQVAFALKFQKNQLNPHSFSIEATELGWWYRSPLPNGENLITLISDSDLWPKKNSVKMKRWLTLFNSSKIYAEGKTWDPVRLKLFATGANISCLNQVNGSDWIATGDAAIALDPLSGQGIEMSLRSGIKAAEVCANTLNNSDIAAQHYSIAVDQLFTEHNKLRQAYYAAEQRWPDAPFWQRRRTPTIVR